MEVALLGAVEVRDDDGAVVEVRGARQQAIVAYLTLAAGAFVPTERLLDEIWAEEPPQGGAATVQVQMSKLRKLLGADAIESSGRAYRLNPTTVDCHRFDELLAEARRAEPAIAAALLTDALQLWRGDALAALEPVPFVVAARARLEEARLTATEERFDALLTTGRHFEVIADLEQFTARHPLREHGWELLMTALYRSGRQSEALRAFQTARQHLAAELGIEPGEALRRTERLVLDHDPSLAPPPAAASTRIDAQSRPVRRTNIAAPSTSFVGRQRELGVVDDLLDRHPVVTLVGPGGTGKTRLAVETAFARQSKYADGVWILELAALREPDQLPTAIATMFGLREFEANNTATNSALDRIHEFLAAKDLLLVFDNCEHLVEAVATFVAAIVTVSPSVRVLATSREGLGVSGETLWPVPPLERTDAAVLFTARATAVAPSFVVTDDARPLVEEICVRLDGLPLAIELAAAKVRTYALPDLVARLDDRFRLLTGGLRTNLPRQQTLRAVVDWSYDLLDDGERQVFDRLSVFAGGCTLEAAEFVCAGGSVEPLDVAEIVTRLVDKSLVSPLHSGLTVRYDLLQTLAHYGRERLAASGTADAVRRRHAEYFDRFSEKNEPVLRRSGSVDVMRATAAELQNLRAAIDWAADAGESERMLRIATNLTWYWWLAGLPTEGVDRIEAALATGSSGELLRATALVDAGLLLAFSSNIERAAVSLHEGIALARRHGDKEIEATGYVVLGQVSLFRGSIGDGVEAIDRAEKLFVELDDDWGAAVALIVRAGVLQAQGDFDGAATGWRSCIERFRTMKCGWGLAVTLLQLANLYLVDNDLAGGRVVLDEATAICNEYEFTTYALMTLGGQGKIELAAGDLDRAGARFQELVDRSRELVAPWLEAWGLAGLSVVARQRGDLDDALRLASAAIATMPESFPTERSEVMQEMGRVSLARGDISGATAYLVAALELAVKGSSLIMATTAGTALSCALVADGRADLAAEVLGAIGAARTAFALPTPTVQAADEREATARIEQQLGGEAMRRSYAAGASSDVATLLERVKAGDR